MQSTYIDGKFRENKVSQRNLNINIFTYKEGKVRIET